MIQLPYKIENNIRHYNFLHSCLYLQDLGKNKYGPKFKISPTDKEVLYKLLVYAIRDEENCFKNGIDLNKGILLNGPVGCGKTSLITLLKQFTSPKDNYLIKSSRDIAIEFNDSGYSVIQKYGRSPKIWCFDDLGIENNIKHFGNECNTIAEVLLQRYDLLTSQGIVTHATTNLNAEELERLYGNRIRSRLRGMFNLIAFGQDSKDKRK